MVWLVGAVREPPLRCVPWFGKGMGGGCRCCVNGMKVPSLKWRAHGNDEVGEGMTVEFMRWLRGREGKGVLYGFWIPSCAGMSGGCGGDGVLSCTSGKVFR